MWRLRLSYDVITEQPDDRKRDITVSEDAKSKKQTKAERRYEERNVKSSLGSFHFQPEKEKALWGRRRL